MAEELQPSANAEASASPAPNLSAILSDPAMLAKIASVMGSLQGGEGSAASPTRPAESAPVSSSSASTDGLAKVLSDPSLMEKLPQIMSSLAPMLAANTSQKTEAVPTSVLPHSPTADRDNLLLAIKPFLSSGRRDAVDTILRLEKLGEFLKTQK